ncbi:MULTISPECIES: TetR family transcriptional regulator [Microbacterium]|uniref:TetR family transcriptional regulator n=1 Tax=Microbacterium wangchenii TaxID=2541726 RepID=A0ABX5SSY7_9MICO|nr:MULTISPECIES: TetR family transcriptional regulator [Microbacterium]MCK6067827.1 TetR/AcrR family transcriptional regulator [Microbacterium sp. EYE_512]QBR89276.1 TetR family transcriptional regulator [Microbacterium wangchenii]TXK10949.1 TetR family transcriptional regulator [Microbacterium wangchenii]
MPESAVKSLRERARDGAREHIATEAMRLFLEQGFDATTIDQIAAAAGISPRSFFRYFSTKEDVVLGGLSSQGEAIRDALESRPAEEGPWEALRAALLTLRPLGRTREEQLAIGRMIHETPSLRARSIEKHLGWQRLFVPDVKRRLGIPSQDHDDPRAHAIVACVLTCLDVVGEFWTRGDGREDIADLWDRAVSAVRS